MEEEFLGRWERKGEKLFSICFLLPMPHTRDTSTSPPIVLAYNVLLIISFKVLDCSHDYEVPTFLDGLGQEREQLDNLATHP